MRADMKEVIVDTGRAGGLPPTRRPIDVWDEDEPPVRHERMRNVTEGKAQRDRLAPLKRFLRGQVGRPWTKVWSEICAEADARTVLGFHLRTHVRDYVDVRCTVDRDGVVWRSSGRYQPFWVDPRNGLLRREPRHRPLPRASDAAPPDRLATPDGRRYVRIAGQWYEVRTVTRETYVRRVTRDWRVTLVPKRQTVRVKRQLSGREKRDLGVA
jgi:hypothetical protein